MKLVFDRLWIQDYMDRVKQQMKDVEQISDSLEAAEKSANPSDQFTIQNAIVSMKHIREELAIIYEVLEELVERMDEAKRILDNVVQEIREIVSF